MSVDLPAPFGPRSPIAADESDPRRSLKISRFPKRTLSPSNSTIAAIDVYIRNISTLGFAGFDSLAPRVPLLYCSSHRRISGFLGGRVSGRQQACKVLVLSCLFKVL